MMDPVRDKYLVTIGLLLVTFVPLLRAASPETGADELPKIILSGIAAYKAEGPEAAVKAWIKGSPIEGSKEVLSQANVLRQIQDFYGPFKGFQLIRSKNLSSNTRVIYLNINFEKGPVFAKFLVYRAEQDWILTSFLLNTNPDLILPSCQ
ncbi:MAG: hypothetical protein LAN37_12705 [Acidobacteriia bacterium]|nr:hypothetical protein [Terriglobia bacterium]